MNGAEGQQQVVWQLSLRPSQGAWREGVPSTSAAAGTINTPETLSIADLKIGQQVTDFLLQTSPHMLSLDDHVHRTARAYRKSPLTDRVPQWHACSDASASHDWSADNTWSMQALQQRGRLLVLLVKHT